MYGDFMYTIKNTSTNTYIVKNSKFISYLYKVDNVNQANTIINNIKKMHPNASHCCYAYVISNYIKFSDDKEPSNTAGSPIKEVLIKNNLNNVLCVVVRYFGGVKLGVGGLIRAYTKSVTSLICMDNLVELVYGVRMSITFSYDYISYIDNLLKQLTIDSKIYDCNVNYVFNTNNNDIIYKLENDKNIIVNYKKSMYIES